MSTAMDMFLSATDSLSFPDILDIDIKSEIDTLVGAPNDFSGFNFNDMPPLEMDDVHDIRWFNSNSNHSNLDFGEDGPAVVNPNAVMPVMSLAQSIRSPSPTLKESHLTFSPATIKIGAFKTEKAIVKKDLSSKLSEVIERKPIIKTVTKVTPVLTKSVVKTTTKTPAILTFRNAINKSINVTPVSNITAIRTVASSTINRKIVNRAIYDDEERAFPKPAYSYSCLIAMALKNSRSGSLPVSEIYNFMCRHFPYFKTAPNGWKNSVRHNLSLNKCFEKIEKPAMNGVQRKGCLWAMNPAKISKMEEEVQKWSRKDPQAIKKAMVYPEHLEALERGEMKFSCSYDEGDNFGDSCGSAEEQSEGSDFEQEIEEAPVVVNSQYEYIQVKEEDTSDLDIEASDEAYEELDDDQELLRVEMALAQKDLLTYERTVNNKRRRTFILQH